jgi:hypothetical protein
MVKLLFADSAADCSVPDVALAPDHAPEALQALALADVHVKVVREPEATAVGFAEKLTDGGLTSDTLALRAVVPPAPVHVSVKVVAAAIGLML